MNARPAVRPTTVQRRTAKAIAMLGSLHDLPVGLDHAEHDLDAAIATALR